MKVFVAGASGALGGPLVRSLIESGHQVWALTRTPSKAGSLRALGATPVVADALDADAMLKAVGESAPDAVVNALTALPPGGPLRASHLEATNRVRTAGTTNLLRAAAAAEVSRFVAESVILVYGDIGDATASEEFPLVDPAKTSMGDAVQALAFLERKTLDASGIVLRYGIFYGPGVGATEYMARMLRRRMMMLPGGGNGVLSWVHVDDAARATVAALERGRPGDVYNVVDDHPASLRDFTEALARRIGAGRPRNAPMWPAKVAAPVAAEFSTARVAVSNAKAKAELGWRPMYPSCREGLETFGRGAANRPLDVT